MLVCDCWLWGNTVIVDVDSQIFPAIRSVDHKLNSRNLLRQILTNLSELDIGSFCVLNSWLFGLDHDIMDLHAGLCQGRSVRITRRLLRVVAKNSVSGFRST